METLYFSRNLGITSSFYDMILSCNIAHGLGESGNLEEQIADFYERGRKNEY